MKLYNVVADIGGTNIRLGYFDENDQVIGLEVYQCNKFDSLEMVLRHYFSEKGLDDGKINACLAIACPVEDDWIRMTNLPWQFSKSELKASLGLNELIMINDYTAIALAITELDDSQKVKVGQGEPVAQKPIAICGPGTGLGVANLVYADGRWVSLGGEGGHVDFAPVNDTEVEILRFLQKKYKRVSVEQLLSGLGLEQMYQALCDIKGEPELPLTAADISSRALDNRCPICRQTLEQFCKTLGSFAGNLALTMASFGGVYIAGGIVPRFIEFFEQSEFRRRFEHKGRFEDFCRSIPTYVITESQPGIIGAAVCLRQFNQ